jgi:hypothetical protein
MSLCELALASAAASAVWRGGEFSFFDNSFCTARPHHAWFRGALARRVLAHEPPRSRNGRRGTGREGSGAACIPGRGEQGPSAPLHDAVDRPKRAYRPFMAHSDATAIGVVTGVVSMMVATVVDTSARSWFGRNFARFGATRVHAMPDGYQLIYKMPLPPYPIIGCPREPHNYLAPGIAATGQGGFIIWPAPRGYGHCCLGYRVTADLPVAPLPLWIARKVTAPAPGPAVPVAFRSPRRGLDVQLDRLSSFIRYSRQRTLGERAVGAGRAGGNWSRKAGSPRLKRSIWWRRKPWRPGSRAAMRKGRHGAGLGAGSGLERGDRVDQTCTIVVFTRASRRYAETDWFAARRLCAPT